ncbi:hypothetical protein J4Q44_G00199000 [Coregonus suidteri]|uniref:Uncharacterized protein n=1 Tax=Coregonus suidteri TaxID=861788 RepID=A0AAN8LHX4_9TELE
MEIMKATMWQVTEGHESRVGGQRHCLPDQVLVTGTWASSSGLPARPSSIQTRASATTWSSTTQTPTAAAPRGTPPQWASPFSSALPLTCRPSTAASLELLVDKAPSSLL